MTDSISAAQTLPVTMIADFACPWCRIGKANLDAAIAQWTGAPVDITYLPFSLDSTLPAGGVDFREHLTQKFQGAPIDAMNTLRKHLCALKGGRLAAACGNAPLLTLAISDIPGDRLDLIGSGPTLADPSNCADALAAAQAFAIRLPEAALQGLRSGAFETPKSLPAGQRVPGLVDAVPLLKPAQVDPPVQKGCL